VNHRPAQLFLAWKNQNVGITNPRQKTLGAQNTSEDQRQATGIASRFDETKCERRNFRRPRNHELLSTERNQNENQDLT
jgi:hypothetical protein